MCHRVGLMFKSTPASRSSLDCSGCVVWARCWARSMAHCDAVPCPPAHCPPGHDEYLPRVVFLSSGGRQVDPNHPPDLIAMARWGRWDPGIVSCSADIVWWGVPALYPSRRDLTLSEESVVRSSTRHRRQSGRFLPICRRSISRLAGCCTRVVTSVNPAMPASL